PRRPHRRPLRPRAPARPRWVRMGVRWSGTGRDTRRGQDPEAPLRRRPAVREPVPERGRDGRAAPAPEHHSHPCRGALGELRLLRDGPVRRQPSGRPPEQAQGRLVDPRADLYALGVTLYKAATGEPPFTSTDWFELARMHVEDPPASLRKKRPALSKRFERVVMKCLAKHPDDRYRDA